MASEIHSSKTKTIQQERKWRFYRTEKGLKRDSNGGLKEGFPLIVLIKCSNTMYQDMKRTFSIR